ncbi:MAG: SpoIIE family protein phosphatase [Bacteroidetes bacterium]|nr:SpoIIE family protein phosphatase [Bacteroidota bacterium]
MSNFNTKPSTALKVLIWMCLVPSFIGQYFKMMHWPGAGVLMMFGILTFCLFYLPLFIVEARKTKVTGKEKTILAVKVLILFVFAFGLLFKIQHWPAAGIFYFVNTFLLYFIVLPYSLYHLVKAGRSDLSQMHHVFLVIFFISYFMNMLVNSSSGKINIDAVLQQGLNTEEAFRTATSRNRQLYTTLEKVTADKNTAPFLKATKLKHLTDSTVNFIRDLKSNLLVNIDKIPKAKADTLSSIYIENKINYDQTSFLLIGTDLQPKKDKLSAHRLKLTIENFKDSLLNLVQEHNRPIINEGLNLSTDNYEDENGEPVTWVEANFASMPLLYVYNTLTNIQYEIKNAEYQALTDIINSGNKDLNTSLFSQIADLNSKYDAVKKQEEISKLKNENQKGINLLILKNSQLNSSQQAIVVFLLIIILFVVLVFFVIRSNILRKKANRTLVQQKEIIEKQKTEVEDQKHLIEEKQKEIIDSISYAKRLQEAILPPKEFVNSYVADNFILYKPKDIVAGDFYWAEQIEDLFFIAAADSTGHGVPGAMVSVVCSNALNRTVKEFNIKETGAILDKTRELVLQTFEKSVSEVKDGMDISLLCIDNKNKKITWSGANNPLWYIQGEQIKEIKGDKQPIGKTEYPKPFTTHFIDYNTDAIFYLFTDGFADQFGGLSGKKFKYKQFSDLILSNKNNTLEQQKQIIENSFDAWKGDLEQVDDVCVIGIKI